MKWGYHGGGYYHDDVGIDIVRTRLIWISIIQHHSCVVNWKTNTFQSMAFENQL